MKRLITGSLLIAAIAAHGKSAADPARGRHDDIAPSAPTSRSLESPEARVSVSDAGPIDATLPGARDAGTPPSEPNDLQQSRIRSRRAPPIAREPSVQQVLAMAQRAAQALAPDRLRELARRARLAGLAPELRLTAERGFDQDLTSSSSAASDSTRAAIGDELRFGATLTFDFDRLVFAAEEVRLLSIERYLVSDRQKLLQEVVRLYFQRRRILREQVDALAPDDDLADSLRETEALLDAITNGAFTRSLGGRN